MKKVIFGTTQLLLSPFSVILMGKVIDFFNVNDGVKVLAGMVGFIILIGSIVMGVMLVVSGHKELKTFSNLDN